MRHEHTDERRGELDGRGARDRRGERGAALVEFAIGATVFLTVMFGVIEFGLLLWTHNALTDAARRGARYAVTHQQSQLSDVQNVVIYGDAVPATGAKPMVANLSPANVAVAYTGFSVGAGRVTVSIENFDYNFVVPLVGLKVRLPRYQTTLTGESAGYTPPPI